MEAKEFDIQLADLELRLERLRSLYEQYFIGVEKLEPTIARRDVDRRVNVLRKVKLRNTAKRFKMQTLIQRYNTLQQYWMRICRQMENGSYTRHLARAARRFGEDAVQAAKLGAPTSTPESQAETQAKPETETEQLSARADQTRAAAEMDLGAMLAAEMDADEQMKNAVEAAFDMISEKKASPDRDLGPEPRTTPNKPLATGTRQQHAGPEAQQPTAQPRRQKPASLPNSPSLAAADSATAGRTVERTQASRTRRRPDAIAHKDSAEAQRAKTSSESLSQARVQRLYAELQNAQQKLNQESRLTQSALEKSLRATEAKLRKKHSGKRVDFRVDVKDGKAVIRPVVTKVVTRKP